MSKDQFKAIRRALGKNTTQLAESLGLGRNGYRTIERIEAGANITGPMGLAMEKLAYDAGIALEALESKQ